MDRHEPEPAGAGRIPADVSGARRSRFFFLAGIVCLFLAEAAALIVDRVYPSGHEDPTDEAVVLAAVLIPGGLLTVILVSASVFTGLRVVRTQPHVLHWVGPICAFALLALLGRSGML